MSGTTFRPTLLDQMSARYVLALGILLSGALLDDVDVVDRTWGRARGLFRPPTDGFDVMLFVPGGGVVRWDDLPEDVRLMLLPFAIQVQARGVEGRRRRFEAQRMLHDVRYGWGSYLGVTHNTRATSPDRADRADSPHT